MLSICKYIMIFSLLFWNLVASSETDPEPRPFGQNLEYFKTHQAKAVELTGKISGIKRHLRARSTFYTFVLSDMNDENYQVEVRLYTINWLKRVNYFKCTDGDTLVIKGGQFYKKLDSDYFGTLRVTHKAPKLNCFSEKELEQENENSADKKQPVKKEKDQFEKR